MARNYTFAPGEYYHLYSRGIEKLPVYREKGDYERFLEAVYLCNSGSSVDIRSLKKERGSDKGLTFDEVFDVEREHVLVHIGVYCLMPNHFHLLVREKQEKGISKFMQKVMTSYTMYFNKKYERTGAVFGSSFKARHVTNDNHLKYLFAYIHMNPKKIITRKQLRGYPYSSFSDYAGIERPQASILHKNVFPDYFAETMEQEIEEWLSYDLSSELAKG